MITAPPAMAMHNSPDVAALGACERSRVSVKMVGNMMELKETDRQRGERRGLPAAI